MYEECLLDADVEVSADGETACEPEEKGPGGGRVAAHSGGGCVSNKTLPLRKMDLG